MSPATHGREDGGEVEASLYSCVFLSLPSVREVEAVGTRPHGESVAVIMRLCVTRQRFAAVALEEKHLERLLDALGGDTSITRPVRDGADRGVVSTGCYPAA